MWALIKISCYGLWQNPGNKYVMFRIAYFDKFEGIVSGFVCRKDNSLFSF